MNEKKSLSQLSLGWKSGNSYTFDGVTVPIPEWRFYIVGMRMYLHASEAILVAKVNLTIITSLIAHLVQ